MDYKDMRTMLSQMLSKTIDCWFYTCQSVLDITDGGLAIDLDLAINKSVCNLSDACIDALKFQYDCKEKKDEE